MQTQAESWRLKDLSNKTETKATPQQAQGQPAFAHSVWSVTSASKAPLGVMPISLLVSYVLSPKKK